MIEYPWQPGWYLRYDDVVNRIRYYTDGLNWLREWYL
jgi:hypothetical protein